MSDLEATGSEWPRQVLEQFVDDDEDDAPAAPVPSKAAGANVLEALKAHRARVAEEQTYDLVVPGWHELLLLRLGSITSEQQQRLVERAQRRKVVASADADFLIAAFREALGRATPGGELGVLVDRDGDPVGLDERLAGLLDLGPVRSARDVVQALFSQANSPSLALSSSMMEWLEWARSASDEIDETFLGE